MALARQLEEFINGKARIVPYWVNGGLGGPIDADLVILSSELVREDLIECGLLPTRGDLIIASRIVDCEALEAVVALEPGLKVLFVNDKPETVRDCLESMYDLGLDYIEWSGWDPEMPPPDPSYRIAVVAGEPDLVPEGVDTVIDIGVRIFDFGTIAEILSRLGIPTADIGHYSRRYLAKIVSLARRLARSTEEARRLSGHLGSVIDSLRHGILVYDGAGRISVCNEELRGLLALRTGVPVGSTLAGMIRHRDLLDFLDCRCGEEEGFFKLPAGQVVVRRFDLGEGGHTVAVFRSEGDEAAEAVRLGREYRKRGHVAKWTMDDIVGNSEALRRVKRIAARLAATDLSILVSGESGTGKELFASAIHTASARSAGPFLAVDLGALSDDLIESELFGYEEGAFTGARKGGKAGFFELADGGTLFLDEIGNISTKVQTRLLRVLQEKEVMRVGGSDIKHVDVRIIAASKEDLLDKARHGAFREDLYFRLKMGWLRIPSLRERPMDIPALIARFMSLEGARGLAVHPEVLKALSDRDWPGNVRELRNTLSYMLAVREGDGIVMADLPDPSYFSGLEPGAVNPGFVRSADRPMVARSISGRSSVGQSGTGESSLGHSGVGNAGAPGSVVIPALSQAERFVILAVAELESTGHKAGRAPVSALARAAGIELGPGSTRAVISQLAAKGYLVSSRGRGGTRLTEAGKQLAELL
jgi:transcriptional regulator with PAS, ATPase and Fis domain